MKLEAIFDKLFDKLAGPTPVINEEVIFEKPLDFFSKLRGFKAKLNIVKDPYGLAFAPNYLLWFTQEQEDITYKIFMSPDSTVWSMLQHYFEISFPTGGPNPWVREISWDEFEEKFEEKK
jgi:hypothetical protein